MRTHQSLYLMFIIIVFAFTGAKIRADIQMASVTGNAYLEGETDHSGIKVKFLAQSPSAVTDSTYTSADGSYTFSVADGVYEIKFIKDGYLTYTYPEMPTLSGDETLDDVTLQAGIMVSGNVSGIWDSNTVIRADSDINIADGDSLIIEPGVTVKFSGNYRMNIYGFLFAEGTEVDSIKFTSNNENKQPGDWNKLQFENPTPGSKMSYCIFEYGGTSGLYNSILKIKEGILLVENSRISNSSSSGIVVGTDAFTLFDVDLTFTNNEIINNQSVGISIINADADGSISIGSNNICNNNKYGIWIYSRTKPQSPYDLLVENNIFKNNSMGIRISTVYTVSVKADIDNNLITHNRNTGISVGTNNYIHNNSIGYHPGTGIISSDGSIGFNNIFNNGKGIEITSNANIYNNNVYSNSTGIEISGDDGKVFMNSFVNNSTYSINNASNNSTSVGYNLFFSNTDHNSNLQDFSEIITESRLRTQNALCG